MPGMPPSPRRRATKKPARRPAAWTIALITTLLAGAAAVTWTALSGPAEPPPRIAARAASGTVFTSVMYAALPMR